MILIAFTGQMGSGKSTAIETLRGWSAPLGAGFANVKFAGTLYELQEKIYDAVSPVYQRPKDFVKDRKLLQWLGTEWGRSLSENLWVDLWKAKVGQIASYFLEHDTEGFITCDDVRFDNEAQAVKDMGGYIIHIHTDRNKERITTANGIKNHASEAGIDSKYLDFSVSNNDTVIEFREKLTKIFEQIAQNNKRK